MTVRAQVCIIASFIFVSVNWMIFSRIQLQTSHFCYAEADSPPHVPSAALTSKMNQAGSPVVLSRHPSVGDRDRDADQSPFGRKDSFGKEELRGVQSDGITISDPRPVFQERGHATHLITPSEIISGVVTSAEMVASGTSQNVEAEAKHVDARKSNHTVKLEAGKETHILPEKKERPVMPSEQTVDAVSERTITDKFNVEDSQPLPGRSVPTLLKQSSGAGDESVVKRATEASEGTERPCALRDLPLPSTTNEGKIIHPQVSGQLSPSTSTFNSADSSQEPHINENPPIDPSLQTAAIQGTLQQVIMH